MESGGNQKMVITYDSKYDILYIKFLEAENVISKEFNQNIILDFNEDGKLVGIEILSASEIVDLKELLPTKFEEFKVANF